MTPQVLTANRLRAGEVVYWNRAKGWVTKLADADVLNGDAEEVFGHAAEWVSKREIVGPYLFDVRVQGGLPIPVKMRERIRAAGPSVRPDLGKQAA